MIAVVSCTLYILWCDWCDGAIAIDIWGHRHANPVIFTLCSLYCALWPFDLTHSRLAPTWCAFL